MRANTLVTNISPGFPLSEKPGYSPEYINLYESIHIKTHNINSVSIDIISNIDLAW